MGELAPSDRIAEQAVQLVQRGEGHTTRFYVVGPEG
ncbi:protein of unknown function [Candidatus Nitrospira inopinata]|uniref:Uncharacterized protein n=1 Tax=Candidatus Nitrospira inopinata TaxID=1715989 RepID=A0A0S4KX80_9BACT|nr:protein of unknown function [Candidatus Nitrospira inopinata]